jgi:hypothetical protein
LAATRLRTEIPAEKLHHMILESVSHPTRVGALIHLEAVRDSILIKDFMQLAGVTS